MPSTNPQPVAAPLTRAAMFLVVTVNDGAAHEETVKGLTADLSGLLRSVGFRDSDSRLSCVMGFGSDAWDRLFGAPRPKELHPFREIQGQHHATATPGDVLFHIRAQRMDMCFELAAQIMARLGGAVATADEVHGFKYFDNRDLLGFVDGTENPVDQEALDATVIGEEDAAFAGGSYVIVQKYPHDLDAWNALSVDEQERVIGRTKLDDIEFDDAVKPADSHVAMTTIRGPDGAEQEIESEQVDRMVLQRAVAARIAEGARSRLDLGCGGPRPALETRAEGREERGQARRQGRAHIKHAIDVGRRLIQPVRP